MTRSSSYLTDILEGGWAVADTKTRIQEQSLLARINELLVSAMPGEKRVLEFVRTRTAGWDVKLTCESCGA